MSGKNAGVSPVIREAEIMTDKREKIAVRPVGNVQSSLLSYLLEKLKEKFPAEFEIVKPMEIPEFAYNRNRNQYNSTAIIKHLRDFRDAENYDKILGIIDKDIYSINLNFVFGEADLKNQTAVISLSRLRQEFYGDEEDYSLFLDRVAKEAVHEIGHLYRMGHCNDLKCVMYFSLNIQDTDRKSQDFCEPHRELLVQKIEA
jgi:archaemetzincin